MTLEELDSIKRSIQPGRLAHTANWKTQFLENAWESLKHPIPYEPWIKEPVQNSVRQEIKDQHDFTGIDPVIVDLNFPDKILIENFKLHLAARRAESNTEHLSRHGRQCNFLDWIHYGVLPYLDLKLWELENDIKIPHRVIADAIYPRGEGGEETVRKTTIPLATYLSENIPPQLFAHAATELAEQNNTRKFQF